MTNLILLERISIICSSIYRYKGSYWMTDDAQVYKGWNDFRKKEWWSLKKRFPNAFCNVYYIVDLVWNNYAKARYKS